MLSKEETIYFPCLNHEAESLLITQSLSEKNPAASKDSIAFIINVLCGLVPKNSIVQQADYTEK